MAPFLKRIFYPLLPPLFLGGCLTINHLNIVADNANPAGNIGVSIIDTAQRRDGSYQLPAASGAKENSSLTVQPGQPMIVIIGNVTDE